MGSDFDDDSSSTRRNPLKQSPPKSVTVRKICLSWKTLTVTDFGGRIMRTLENEAQRVFAAVLHGTRNGERLYCTVVG